MSDAPSSEARPSAPHGDSDGAAPAPMPWEIPFTWEGFLDRWFGAIERRDAGALRRLAVVDTDSECAGRSRFERSLDGLIATLTSGLWAIGGEIRHERRTVVATATDAVVEWTRTAGDDAWHGVSFMHVDARLRMLTLYRWHEEGPPWAT